MRKYRLLVLMSFALAAVPIFGGSSSGKIEYGTYINQRYEYEVKYPKELLFPTDPPDNNDGRELISKDRKVAIYLQGKHLVVTTWKEEYQEELADHKKAKIITKTFNKKFFSVSGVEAGNVFYMKELYRGPDDNPVVWRFDASYPVQDKKFWEPIVEFCAKSLKPGKSSKPALWNHYSGLGPNGDEFK